jgi:DNA-binding LacI/PurR family transcriptional regulator
MLRKSSQNDQPLRELVSGRIEDMIRGRGMRQGDLLPSYRQLARQLKVSLVTIHQAMTMLSERGLVHLEKGRRTAVGSKAASLTNRLAEIGLVFPSSRSVFMNNDYLIQILRGVMVESDAVKADVRLFCMAMSTQPSAQTLSPSEVAASGVDGVICLGTASKSKYFRDFINEGVVMVIADAWAKDLPLDCVVCDNEQAGEKIINHLIELGHRRIAYVDAADPQSTGSQTESSSDVRERREAYLHCMEKAGLPSQVLYAPPYSFPTTSQIYPEWVLSLPEQIRRMAEPPTALVVYDVIYAHQILALFERVGMRAPADYSLVAMAGSPADALSKGRTPTYCHFNFMEMGRQAMRILADRCRQHRRPRLGPHLTRISCELVLGDTVGPPSKRP